MSFYANQSAYYSNYNAAASASRAAESSRVNASIQKSKVSFKKVNKFLKDCGRDVPEYDRNSQDDICVLKEGRAHRLRKYERHCNESVRGNWGKPEDELALIALTLKNFKNWGWDTSSKTIVSVVQLLIDAGYDVNCSIKYEGVEYGALDFALLTENEELITLLKTYNAIECSSATIKEEANKKKKIRKALEHQEKCKERVKTLKVELEKSNVQLEEAERVYKKLKC